MGNRNKRNGWAKTKEKPHKRHPAYYEHKDKFSDSIWYWLFTHSSVVEEEDKSLTNTIKMNSNIEASERGKKKSFLYPKRFSGKRSALGKKETKFSFTDEDYNLFHSLKDNLETVNVTYTSNSKNKKKKKKRRCP